MCIVIEKHFVSVFIIYPIYLSLVTKKQHRLKYTNVHVFMVYEVMITIDKLPRDINKTGRVVLQISQINLHHSPSHHGHSSRPDGSHHISDPPVFLHWTVILMGNFKKAIDEGR